MRPLKKSIDDAGGVPSVALACGKTPRAIYKWLVADALPRTTYSHEGVKIAAIATGLFDLRSAKQEDKGLRQRFEHNYAVVIRRAQEGQPLDGKILTGIGHDSQKTAFELANELADQQTQARILKQGIPTDGKSARELLMAKFKNKTQEQRP